MKEIAAASTVLNHAKDPCRGGLLSDDNEEEDDPSKLKLRAVYISNIHSKTTLTVLIRICNNETRLIVVSRRRPGKGRVDGYNLIFL